MLFDKNEDDDVGLKILNASVELFGTKPYRDVTIQDITDRVGLTKGAFYYYYSDKESLLYRIHNEFITYELERAKKSVKYISDPRAQLKQFIYDLVESIVKYQPYVTIFFRDKSYLGKENFEKIRIKRDEYESILVDILERGRRSGQFHFKNTILISRAIFGMCNWLYQWYNDSGSLSAEDIAEELFSLIEPGITLG